MKEKKLINLANNVCKMLSLLVVSAASSTISDVFLMGGGVNIDSGFVVGVAGFISDVLSSVAGLSTPELTRSALLKV